MQGNVLDFWICSVITYFQISLDITDDRCLLLVGNHLEGLAQAWWKSHAT
jgi:hypothetical protein